MSGPINKTITNPNLNKFNTLTQRGNGGRKEINTKLNHGITVVDPFSNTLDSPYGGVSDRYQLKIPPVPVPKKGGIDWSNVVMT